MTPDAPLHGRPVEPPALPASPPAVPPEAGTLQTLAAVVLADRESEVLRIRDRALAEARESVRAAEEQVEGLTSAARDLGDLRGRAAETALEEEADREVRRLAAQALEQVVERFLRRVETALRALRETGRHAEALAAWAHAAAAAMDRPSEVFTAPEDRPAVYAALLAAGARDFQVRADRDVSLGFVVRDLDGRTILDRRPAATIAEHAEGLRTLLQARLPPSRDDPGGSPVPPSPPLLPPPPG